MTPLANNNTTNFNTKRNEKNKGKKRKKQDPWKKPKTHGIGHGAKNLIRTTHTRNGKRRLRLAYIARTPNPSPSPTPPGTPKDSPQPRTEAERGMHRYAPLHHGTCYMVPFVHRQPLF